MQKHKGHILLRPKWNYMTNIENNFDFYAIMS